MNYTQDPEIEIIHSIKIFPANIHPICRHEPDFVVFKTLENNVLCVIRRIEDTGHLTGYVGLPLAFDMDTINSLNVHGGITFDEEYSNYPYGGYAGMHVIGFDCLQSADFAPYRPDYHPNGVYRDIDFVVAELKSLSRQTTTIIKDMMQKAEAYLSNGGNHDDTH